MNQLHGKFVNVVLSVEDGRGMEFVRHPIHVAANYNGRILESDRISIDDHATFNTELIWEVDKKDLRKIRSSNQPLRVECISTDSQNRRDRIGFVLLSLRSAQIIPLKDAKCPINFKWHKLIGCQADKKKHHPELNLALTIRDHMFNSAEEILPKIEPLLCEEEFIAPEEDTEFTTNFPLKYLDDGYIQIGDDENYECFTLNLLVKEAKNLDILLPEELVFRQNNEKYYISFKIFGVTIKTKPFYKNFHGTFSLNEKVVVRILSSEKTLLEFFRTQDINITLFNSHELLGSTEVELGLVSFIEQTGKFFFKLPRPNGIVPFGGDDVSPSLEIKTWIKRITDHRIQSTIEEKLPTKVVMSNLEKPLSKQGFGDQLDTCILGKMEKVDVKSKSECTLSTTDYDNINITKSVDTVIKNVALSPRQITKYDVMGTYVQYVLELNLRNLVWKIAPKDKILIFKFLHPRASNYITIFTQISNVVGELTDLKNISVKISYVSITEQIANILNAWPPKLVLTDEREKLLSEEYEFDASKFFSQECNSYSYVADLKAVRTLQCLARLDVNLTLHGQEIGELKEENTDFYLKPPIIDEILSIKELADIEAWKKSEKVRFENEMEKFKQEEGEKLENYWNEKKRIMEEKLEGQMEKCKTLQEQLQNKFNSFKTEKYLIRRKNQANIFEEIFTENWEKYSNADLRDVIEILSKTQRDNEYLRKLVEDQRNKLESFEKAVLTKEQTTNLLQELKILEKGFQEAQDAKKYFKEQWQKACDEIHEIKTEEYKSIHLNLQKSRQELSHLSLDSFNRYIDTKFDINQDILTNRSIPSAQSFY